MPARACGLADELAAIAKRLERDSAVLFPRPGGHEIPVVANLFADRDWVAEPSACTEDQLLPRFLAAASHPLPTLKWRADRCRRSCTRRSTCSRQLPIPKHNERDSGPYITAGLLIARNPKTGVQNVSIHRCQISGPNRIGVLLLPRHTLLLFQHGGGEGEALEIAIVIGVHPALHAGLAGDRRAGRGRDGDIAGALLGRPVDVVKCLTNSVRVPAHAEIVHRRAASCRACASRKGRSANSRNITAPRANREVIEIDAVTHRKNADLPHHRRRRLSSI